MATLGERIRALRKARELTQEALGKELNVGKSTISQYENDINTPDASMLQAIASRFNVSSDYLLGLIDQPRAINSEQKTRKVPLLGHIHAGTPILAEANRAGEIEIPSDWVADFALRVVGDAMSWAGIHQGDVAALKRTAEAKSGQVVAAGVEEDTWAATLKYYIRDNGDAVLRSANPEYVDTPMTDRHRIIGGVVGILKEPPPYQEYGTLLTSKAATDQAWSDTIETATQLGLDGSEVGHMIRMFAKVSKVVPKEDHPEKND